jgi:apolipoprotein N-acyltransferase
MKTNERINPRMDGRGGGGDKLVLVAGARVIQKIQTPFGRTKRTKVPSGLHSKNVFLFWLFGTESSDIPWMDSQLDGISSRAIFLMLFFLLFLLFLCYCYIHGVVVFLFIKIRCVHYLACVSFSLCGTPVGGWRKNEGLRETHKSEGND